jgi:hypothetical protein
MLRKRFFLLSFVVLSFILVLPGCGNKKLKTERVSGIVTMDGSPVVGATVTFSPVDRTKSHPATGTTDSTGKYQLQTMLGEVDAGTTPGEYKVMITKTENVETGRVSQVMAGDQVEEVKEMRAEHRLPLKYSVPDSTPLKATVINGSNTFDFFLTP